MKVDNDDIRHELDRDVPFPILTRRVEDNNFQVLSGIFEGETIGTPISIIVRNSNVESEKYLKIRGRPRPGHADLTYRQKYGHVDWRGGSRASGRTWISVTAAGAIARKLCLLKGITIESRIIELAGTKVAEENLRSEVKRLADLSKKDNDATGGIIEVSLSNLPLGLVDAGMNIASQYAPDVNFAEIAEAIRNGQMEGKIVDVIDEEDGEHIEVYID